MHHRINTCFMNYTHRWMLACGAKYEPVTQTYVTDAHQRHSTLLYRTWFCDLDYFLSLRMHRWVCFPNSSLQKLKAHYKDKWPDDSLGHKIPVEDVGKFPPGKQFFYSPDLRALSYFHNCVTHLSTS